jgi:lysophospholipase L1-like esterase
LSLRFAFFGDSICVGQGVSPHRTWAVRLAARIEAAVTARGGEITVLNPSINGDITRRALERMAFDIQAGGVDAIYVQFGFNDANIWETDRGLPRVSRDAFGANLREIVTRARRFGAKAVLMAVNHPTTRTTTTLPHSDITYDEAVRRYNDTIRALAAEDGAIVLCDMEIAFSTHMARTGATLSELLLPDGLHLSAAGHDVYLDALTPLVVPAAEALVARNA